MLSFSIQRGRFVMLDLRFQGTDRPEQRLEVVMNGHGCRDAFRAEQLLDGVKLSVPFLQVAY
jgi:hypothetical protein